MGAKRLRHRHDHKSCRERTGKDYHHRLWLVATRVFNVRLLHAFAFSKKLLWLAQTQHNYFETQMHAVDVLLKRQSQLGF